MSLRKFQLKCCKQTVERRFHQKDIALFFSITERLGVYRPHLNKKIIEENT